MKAKRTGFANDPTSPLMTHSRHSPETDVLCVPTNALEKRSCRRRISQGGFKAELTRSIAIGQKVFLSNAANLGVGDDRYAVIGNFCHYPSVQ
jgi:hypothetical protein